MKLKPGRILEFFIIGVVLGITEDLIAVYFSTGEFSWNILWIVALVAIPFAVISELIVDYFKPFHKKKDKGGDRDGYERVTKNKLIKGR